MALSGAVGDTFEVDITLDRSILDTHQVYIEKTDVIQLLTPGDVPVNSLTLTFLEGEHDVSQPIKVIGSAEGTFPLPCICTSAYYQSQGILKEEESTIFITFTEEQNDKFNGNIAGIYNGGNRYEGSLYAKVTIESGPKTLWIGKRYPIWGNSGNWGVSIRREGPGGTAIVSGAQYVAVTLPSAGVYYLYCHEVPGVFALEDGYASIVGYNTWFMKLGTLASPDLDSRSVQANGLVYKRNTTTALAYGPLNPVIFNVGATLSSKFCGSFSRVGSLSVGGSFTGTGSPVSYFECRVDGYYNGPVAGVDVRSNGGYSIGGIAFTDPGAVLSSNTPP